MERHWKFGFSSFCVSEVDSDGDVVLPLLLLALVVVEATDCCVDDVKIYDTGVRDAIVLTTFLLVESLVNILSRFKS